MRARRLKSREQFQALLACGAFVRTEHFVMLRMALQPHDGMPAPAALQAFPDGRTNSWLGAMVPKRWAKRAVTRNLIKRQIYACELPAPLTAQDTAYLVRLRSTFDLQRFKSASSDALRSTVRSEIEQLFSKAAQAVQAI